MKKIVLFITLFISTFAFAQEYVFKGSLNEALAKAKAENKAVMIVGSTTWCGPCKAMEANIYPSEIFMSYAKDNLVFVKYLLDKADPDKIVEKFNVTVYPTYLFLDANGTELMRFVGGNEDAQAFVNDIKSALKPENSFAAREQKFKQNPDASLDYLEFLENDCYLKDKATKMLDDLFASRSVAENFSPASLQYYHNSIKNCDSKVLNYMIKNKKEVAAVMGEDNFNEFMLMKGVQLIQSELFNRRFKEVNFLKVLDEVNALPYIASPYSKFIAANKDYVVKRDISNLTKQMSKNLKKIDTNNRKAMVTTLQFLTQEDPVKYKYSVLNIYETAAKYEKNEKFKQEYLSDAASLKRLNSSFRVY